MVVFVSGGSGSGKSAFAESLITDSEYSQRTYIATMQVWDREGERRVERHRALRRDKGFETVECPRGLERLEVPSGAVLLEDLTNLFMNEYFGADAHGALERVEHGLRRFAEKSGLFVIVGNDLFCGGDEVDAQMGEFILQQGRLNAFAAHLADVCYEVTLGCPVKRVPQEPKTGRGLTLVVGGAAQGKTQWAIRSCDRGRGVTRHFEEASRADVFCGLEAWLRTADDPVPELEVLLERNPDLTIVCCEVGCGIVPMEAGDRAWRERVGRVCCMLAGRASRVVRLWCGIPTLLKGELIND